MIQPESLKDLQKEPRFIKWDLKISYLPIDKDSFRAKYALSYHKNCCLSILTFGGLMDPYIVVENEIDSAGRFKKNIYAAFKQFGIKVINFNKDGDIKPINYYLFIMPLCFSDRKVAVGEMWTFKTEDIRLNYQLKEVNGSSAVVEGSYEERLFFSAAFDIERGCILNYELYMQKDGKRYLLQAIDIVKQSE